MSAADDALRAIMDAIEIDTVAEVSAVHFTPVGLADLANALADMIEAARAEGEAAGAARERAAVWRHIAEAPRDGSHILLFFPDTRIHAALVAEGFFDTLFDGVWMLSRGSSAPDLRVRSPTHWAPLPEPPAAGVAR